MKNILTINVAFGTKESKINAAIKNLFNAGLVAAIATLGIEKQINVEIPADTTEDQKTFLTKFVQKSLANKKRSKKKINVDVVAVTDIEEIPATEIPAEAPKEIEVEAKVVKERKPRVAKAPKATEIPA